MGSDREEIIDVLVRYATAIDTRDWPLFRTCFIDDITADYGDIGSWQGIDEFTTFMITAHAGMGRTQHFLSNFVIDVEGHRAASVAYVHAVTVLASNPDDWIDTVGTHEDEIIHGADGWRIAKRTFQTTRTIFSPSLSDGSHSSNGPEVAT